MTVAIEDVGFEIRDSLHWLYGSGFPKSLDVSKAIDKQRDDRAEVYEVTAWVRQARDAAGVTNAQIDAAFGFSGMAGHWTSARSQPTVPTLEQVPTLLDVLGVRADDVPDEIRHLLWDLNGRKGQPGENWARREIIGTNAASLLAVAPGEGRDRPPVDLDITAPATDAAREWAGWGTALKPAHEPIVLARKPLVGTVAANVMEYGTGALNIDATRVGSDAGWSYPNGAGGSEPHHMERGEPKGNGADQRQSTSGRWPANLILTHSPDCQQTGTITDTFTVVAGFRDYAQNSNFGARAQVTQKPQSVEVVTWDCVPGCPVAALNTQSGNLPTQRTRAKLERDPHHDSSFGVGRGGTRRIVGAGETGGASRFFTTTEWDPKIDVPFLYVAKPSRRDRNAGLDGMPTKTNIYGMRPRIPEGGDKPGSINDKFQTAPAQNFHPTVKPVALMRHLVKLVTPPGGTVLDPFLGSGTTAVAATLEGFAWIGCELTDDYLPIIQARVAWAEQHQPEPDLTLFTDAQ
jgi:hypothetical protein